jgi:nucleoid-associated protein YgaU
VPDPDPTSRYAGLPSIGIAQPDGTVRELGAPRVVPESPTKGSYVVHPGDRLDLLGAAATGDSTRWWVLADANPWPDATELEELGQIVELPDA